MTKPKPEITTPRLLETEPEVSYSAWKRWQACNFQEALLRLGPGVVPRAPKDRRQYLVGNVVHKLLNEHVIPDRRPVELMQIVDTFEYEAAKPGMRFKSMEDKPALLAKSVSILGVLTPPLLNLLKHAKTVASEVEIKRRLPDASGNGWFWMLGVLDLVVELHDGRNIILDFKTSQSFDRVQLLWYAAIWTVGFDTPPAALAFLLPDGETYRLAQLETDHEELMTTVYVAARLASALKGTSFPSNPEYYRCKACRVRGSCADSAYKTNRGRTSVH